MTEDPISKPIMIGHQKRVTVHERLTFPKEDWQVIADLNNPMSPRAITKYIPEGDAQWRPSSLTRS